MYGTVWIVATPLGNLGDFSPRARQALQDADLILAEDTRRSGQFLQRIGISGKRFLSLHEHNETARLADVLELLAQGHNVALISDAGTPLMADPGYRLVAACRKQNIAVVPVPGPCAPITALMASGLPPYPFAFLGFLPRKSGDARSVLEAFACLDMSLVFFERKNRVPKTLDLAHLVLGEREFCLARELTKKHEEFITGTLGRPLDHADQLLGEITVVIGPPAQRDPTSAAEILSLMEPLIHSGMRPKDAARRVRAKVSGWAATDIYDLVVRQNTE